MSPAKSRKSKAKAAPKPPAAAKATPRPRWRRIVRVAVIAIVAVALIPVLLIPLYILVNPVGTNIVATRIVDGPLERQWVPFDDVAKVLVESVMMSEDARFCDHHGVDWGELRDVLDNPDGPNRGASTIAMQTVRNLFLWMSRSYIRKGIEIPLALYADTVWGKRREMEIYLNIAQWGPAIFGAEAAAQYYFKRPARDLTARQAALLAVTLPNPIARDPARPSATMQSLARRVEGLARKSGPYIVCLYP